VPGCRGDRRKRVARARGLCPRVSPGSPGPGVGGRPPGPPGAFVRAWEGLRTAAVVAARRGARRQSLARLLRVRPTLALAHFRLGAGRAALVSVVQLVGASSRARAPPEPCDRRERDVQVAKAAAEVDGPEVSSAEVRRRRREDDDLVRERSAERLGLRLLLEDPRQVSRGGGGRGGADYGADYGAEITMVVGGGGGGRWWWWSWRRRRRRRWRF
jgi:hypothetical protein